MIVSMFGRGGRVVYGARLLSECTLARTAGSNPALSVLFLYDRSNRLQRGKHKERP